MYYIIGGDQKEYGPATVDELRQWIREGRLSASSQARSADGKGWSPLATFPEFAEAIQAQSAGLAAAPGAVPPPDGAAYTAYILSRPVTLNVGECFAQSWNLLSQNFGVIFGATALIWLISVVMQFLPLVGIFYWVIRGVLYGGLYLVFLNLLRGRGSSVNEAFSGFGPPFAQLMLAGLVSSVLSGLGVFFCVLPWIYFSVAWVFCVPLAADKRLEFWSAMELSRKVVNRVWFQVFLLIVLAFLPVILTTCFAQIKLAAMIYPAMQGIMNSGAPDPARLMRLIEDVAKFSIPLTLLVKVVLLFNLPFALGALMAAYETLFGARSTPNT